MPKQKTKAELEQDIKSRDEAIEAMHRQIQQLQQQLASGVESSAMYRQALNDAEAARKDAEMWRGLYENLVAKQSAPEPKPEKKGLSEEELYRFMYKYQQFPKPKNTSRPGPKNKLSLEQVEQIKERRKQGVPLRKLAVQYGVSLATIQRALGLI